MAKKKGKKRIETFHAGGGIYVDLVLEDDAPEPIDPEPIDRGQRIPTRPIRAKAKKPSCLTYAGTMGHEFVVLIESEDAGDGWRISAHINTLEAARRHCREDQVFRKRTGKAPRQTRIYRHVGKTWKRTAKR